MEFDIRDLKVSRSDLAEIRGVSHACVTFWVKAGIIDAPTIEKGKQFWRARQLPKLMKQLDDYKNK